MVYLDPSDLDLDDCNIQSPIILVGDIETKFIDLLGWKYLI